MKKILLAEDNKTNQVLISHIAVEKGWDLTIVTNGRDVVEKVKRDYYDMILMDIQMPIMNGYEATMKIRELEKSSGKKHIIIAVTAFAMKGDREKSLESGMNDYISKPIVVDEFIKKVESYFKD